MMIRLIITFIGFFSCSIAPMEVMVSDPDFKVLGYLYSEDDWEQGLREVDWSVYTDINLAFIQPDHQGNFEGNEAYEKLVKKAREHGVRIFISIGGGGPPEYLADLIKPDKRNHWVEEIVKLVLTYDFDGVDVDLENNLINENYAPFVKALSTELKRSEKLMTAALATWNGDKVPDEVLALYDQINIMSYDATGPWDLDLPGQHSPYEMAEEDIHYYHVQRGIPADKLLLGLPFFGYGFGPGAHRGLWYKQIIEAFPTAYLQDSVVYPDGGILYYNSRELIKRKTALAKARGLGGVMVWHVQADSQDEFSLLSAIKEELR
ncbi:glycosyl hydrolase family 18 protein [Cyclobacterium sp.]|uniref:glycosyl hydrolase family 18 protein n=1 Tax=Cyclobacterium sp. TaxID=1966343 RepID=UPI0019CBEA53|nr:glycosyl hydrolase family 18 protein [Cyclobacterium sp.]MBD3627182.1 hypothetical protein [Cyclobacterium sp.]